MLLKLSGLQINGKKISKKKKKMKSIIKTKKGKAKK